LIKRIFDILVSAALLLLFAPLMLFTAIVVRYSMGAPVLFRQQRPGLMGKPFEVVKFRSMSNGRDAAGRLLDDGERLTPFSRLLRKTSLDELPELWNVLKGDMSLVGPRPLLMQYLERYSTEQARRHEVRPGLTGWAQVNGRNAVSWDEKFRLDVWYVDHQSFLLDIRILLMTVVQVLFARGINQPNCPTAKEFKGNIE